LTILDSTARERGATRTMEHSEELRDLTIRFYEATTSGDLSFFDRHVSLQEEGVVFVGTDPDEWWEGFDAFREAMRAQSEAMGGMHIVPGELRAYREGEVGWVVDRDASFELADGTQIPFRSTLVFHREDSEWKLVHLHSSLGVRNEEMFGEDVTSF
jgi:SnoaL-like domain